MLANFSRKRIIFLTIFVVFGVLYCLVSLPNHYFFRTAALDMGMFNNALFDFAHFRNNDFTLTVGGAEVNYFGDHFSPITILYAPFYYLFGSYTLLIIQIFAILFGGYGVYRYGKLYHKTGYLPLVILFQFFSIWGIYSALSFDFHNNVIAATMAPWLILYYEKGKTKKFLLFFALMLITKENIAIWLAFILIGLVVKNKKFNLRELIKLEIPLFLFTVVYFIIIVGLIMPVLRDGHGTDQLARYHLLGNSLSEIIATIVKNPKYPFSLLFENSSGDLNWNGIKPELHFMVLVSGGFALIFRPTFLLMLLPIYAQKMFANTAVFWGINFQYSIEYAPIISLCLIHFLDQKRSKKWTLSIALAVTLCTVYFTYRTMEKRVSIGYKKVNTQFYSGIHYQSPLDVSAINKALELVPDDAIVSASTNLVPHLAMRDKIYLFPHTKDAHYIVLLTDHGGTYPISKEKYQKRINVLKNSGRYVVEYEANDLLILRRTVD